MSSYLDSDAVDAFGRSIQYKGRGAGAPFEEQRSRRSSSRGRRAPSPPSHRPAYHRGSQSSHGDGRRFHDRRSDARSERPLSTLYSLSQQRSSTTTTTSGAVSLQNLGAMQSLKTFMFKNNPESPEQGQELYAKYQLQFLGDYSEAFFQSACGEEWFQDRYNPIHIVKRDQESAAWAAEESERFHDELCSHPNECVSACSLDPSGKHSHYRSSTNNGTDERAANSPSTTEIFGKHLPGHEGRTVYVSEIHACYPKSQLRESLKNALAFAAAEAEPPLALDLVPQRVLISPPVWSAKSDHYKFERTAWLVMSSPTAASKAVEVLKNLSLQVRPLGEEMSEEKPIATFKLHAAIHSTSNRLLNSLPELISSAVRVEADIERALRLCVLLDEERNIPIAQRFLSTVRDNEAVVKTLTVPTQLLDLAIAYLRRVHFFSFYTGKQFAEEAQLLAHSSSVVFRTKPYIAADGEKEFSVRDVLEKMTIASESLFFVDLFAVASAGGAMETEEGEEEKTEMAVSTAPAKRIPSLGCDPKLAMTMETLLEKVKTLRRERAEGVGESQSSKDAKDAAELEKLQEVRFEHLVRERCKFEQEEKCRCCFEKCNKLFKAIGFLIKHLKTKHEGFGSEELLQDAMPFLRARFFEEPLEQRPLPPIEAETAIGVELKTVKQLLEKPSPPPTLITPPPPFPTHSYNDRRPSYGGDQRKRRSDDFSPPSLSNSLPTNRSDDRDRFREQEPTGTPRGRFDDDRGEKRKLPSYNDVDAPKEQLVTINFGNIVPPPSKKRKFGAVAKTADSDENKDKPV